MREYQTDVGPTDYVLFIDGQPVGVTEAKPEDWGQKSLRPAGRFVRARALPWCPPVPPHSNGSVGGRGSIG